VAFLVRLERNRYSWFENNIVSRNLLSLLTTRNDVLSQVVEDWNLLLRGSLHILPLLKSDFCLFLMSIKLIFKSAINVLFFITTIAGKLYAFIEIDVRM